MKTDELLRNTYRLKGSEHIPFTHEELLDRRRLLRRIIAGSKFSQCTNNQLDNLTACQLPDGRYLINDWDGYEWTVKTFEKAEGVF